MGLTPWPKRVQSNYVLWFALCSDMREERGVLSRPSRRPLWESAVVGERRCGESAVVERAPLWRVPLVRSVPQRQKKGSVAEWRTQQELLKNGSDYSFRDCACEIIWCRVLHEGGCL
jgi:hypothetical protein